MPKMELKEPGADLRQNKVPAFFRSLTLFANLSHDDVARFADASQIKNYKKGKLLYLEGERGDLFYIICSGWVKLFHATEEGEEVIMTMLTKNDITGESAIFENGRFASSAQVVEDAQILSVPLPLLKEQMRANSQLAFNMLDSMMQYQRRMESHLAQYQLYNAPQRIGCFLLGLCPVLEQKDGAVVNLPYDKTLIASILNMTGPTFSRALNILREETGIQISGTQVTINSMERLVKFLDGSYLHLSPHKD